jgi:allantoicase
VAVVWARIARGGRLVDFAAIEHGGLAIDASDTHYGHPNEMLMPGRAKNMAEGWETRRRRGPGHDWAIVRLGAPGVISKVEIDTNQLDTNHYKGNYPDSASLDGQLAGGGWSVLLPQTKLRPHHRHVFTSELHALAAISHVRLNIYPDGGVSRLRIYGRLAAA